MIPPGHPSDGVEPRRNFLLRALPADEYALLVAAAEPIEAGMRQVAYGPGEPIRHAYFPLQAVYSLVALADDGTAAIEVATVGREGMVGLPAFLGAPASPNLALCQIPGPALRVPAEVVGAALATGGALSALLAHYTQATLVQLAQNVACNRLHRIDQRCARWLLLTHDRVGRDQFPLTHALLAQMLGVRRATVSVSAARLQAASLIRYTHGVVSVVDRAGLAAAACDCYPLVRREFDALLPPTPTTANRPPDATDRVPDAWSGAGGPPPPG